MMSIKLAYLVYEIRYRKIYGNLHTGACVSDSFTFKSERGIQPMSTSLPTRVEKDNGSTLVVMVPRLTSKKSFCVMVMSRVIYDLIVP